MMEKPCRGDDRGDIRNLFSSLSNAAFMPISVRQIDFKKIGLNTTKYRFIEDPPEHFCRGGDKLSVSASMKNQANKIFEEGLRKDADKLRMNLDATEYKPVVRRLSFLRYVTDACKLQRTRLKAKLRANETAFDDAIIRLKRDNPSFRSVFSRNFAQLLLDDRTFEDQGISRITAICDRWRGTPGDTYEEVAVFYVDGTQEETAKFDFVLTLGLYGGYEAVGNDDEEFEVEFPRVVATMDEQLSESAWLQYLIKKNLNQLERSGKNG